MNQAFPRKFFNQLGLVSLLVRCLSFDVTREPPYTEQYVRWCGRTEGASPPPTQCAPGMVHLLGGESPLHARQGEVLAGRQGCPP